MDINCKVGSLWQQGQSGRVWRVLSPWLSLSCRLDDPADGAVWWSLLDMGQKALNSQLWVIKNEEESNFILNTVLV